MWFAGLTHLNLHAEIISNKARDKKNFGNLGISIERLVSVCGYIFEPLSLNNVFKMYYINNIITLKYISSRGAYLIELVEKCKPSNNNIRVISLGFSTNTWLTIYLSNWVILWLKKYLRTTLPVKAVFL